MKTRYFVRSSHRPAFTLVEVLVTISVIAVLAGLFFGVAGRISQQATRVDSVNTMRNIGRAIAQYTTDHQQMLPGPMPGQQHPGFLKGGRWLSNFIQPYLAPSQPASTSADLDASLLRGFAPKHWEQWYWKQRPATPRVYEIPYSMYRDSANNQIYPFGRVSPSTENPTNYLVMQEKFRLPTMVAFRTYHGAENSALAPAFGEIQSYSVRLYFDWHVEIVETDK